MTRGYLLDTNVVSEPGRRSPDPNVVAWLDQTSAWSAHISALTIGEIEQGAARLGDGGHRYVAWLLDSLLPHYAGRVLPVDQAVATAWGRLRGRHAARGRTLPVIDSLLVVTAIVHDLTLVTRNTRDVRDLGVPIIDPGDPGAPI